MSDVDAGDPRGYREPARSTAPEPLSFQWQLGPRWADRLSTALGVAALVAGSALVVLAVALLVQGADPGLPTQLLAGAIPMLVVPGLVLALGRSSLTLRRTEGDLAMGWGLLGARLRATRIPLQGIDRVRVLFDRTPRPDVEPARLLVALERGGSDLPLLEPMPAREARERARQIADYLALPLEDEG